MVKQNKLIDFNTEGMTLEQGFSFLRNIHNDKPLGTNDELIYNNTLIKMEELISGNKKKSDNWDKVKEKLTAKQLLFVLE